jgi:beta-glucanase (GH16 family)
VVHDKLLAGGAVSGVADGRRLVWSDEFDGPMGLPPDRAVWGFELGGGGFGNRELQRYTDRLANAARDGRGNLAVTACASDAEYTSARLVSKGKVEVCYGLIETRVRVPRGAGLWPGVWALGRNIDTVSWPGCGEIDLMEHVGVEPRRAFGTIHCPGHAGAAGFRGTVDFSRDLAEDFHCFAVDWTPERIEWSLDGLVYHAATPDDVPGGWVFDHPFYLLINLAVGGDLGGPISPETEFPSQLLVDYVRVYAPHQP